VVKAPVSVIIPCFRCSDTLERAVLSVVNQTLKPEELILIDDASGDDTLTIAEGLKEQYGKEWIRVLTLPSNMGPAAARNVGWEHAKEPYLAFLDADDSWHPRKLEVQYGWMEVHPQVVLTGHPCIFLSAGSPSPSLPTGLHAQPVRRTGMLLSNRFSTPSVMLIRSMRFRFDTDQRYSEDYLLWLQIILKGYAAWWLEVPLAYLHKAPFGASGLSAQLWAMEKGELATYWRVRQQGLINLLSASGLTLYSLTKYLIRHLRRNGL
jgi:glycosyltransferase involved in cell wall biosynthesis